MRGRALGSRIHGWRFFHQKLILGIASMAAMFYNSRRMCEPPNSSSWTVTPNGDAHPEMRSVPSATGFVLRDGRNELSGDNDGRWSPLSEGLRVRSSEVNLLSKGHCKGDTRVSGDAGYVRGG